MDKIFFKAAKQRLRFEYKGQISTEDLFQLSLRSLDTIGIALHKKIEETSGSFSLLTPKSTADTTLLLKLEVVKAVMVHLQEEAEQKETRAKRKAQRQRLLAIKDRKLDAALEDMSLEDLDKALDELS